MKINLLLVTILALLISCNPEGGKLAEEEAQRMPSQELNYDEKTTQQVLDHHFKAFVENDLEEVMADYTEESILITPDRTYRGLAEIRENFVNAYAALPRDSTIVKLIKNLAIKDVGYIIWEADAPTLEFKNSSDTFIIHDGKILRQTFIGVVTPK